MKAGMRSSKGLYILYTNFEFPSKLLFWVVSLDLISYKGPLIQTTFTSTLSFISVHNYLLSVNMSTRFPVLYYIFNTKMSVAAQAINCQRIGKDFATTCHTPDSGDFSSCNWKARKVCKWVQTNMQANIQANMQANMEDKSKHANKMQESFKALQLRLQTRDDSNHKVAVNVHNFFPVKLWVAVLAKMLGWRHNCLKFIKLEIQPLINCTNCITLHYITHTLHLHLCI